MAYQQPFTINRLEVSNNWAERSIKPFVRNQKSFLFANTSKGATGSAVKFSLIKTAIENNLDSYKYLSWLLNNRGVKYETGTI